MESPRKPSMEQIEGVLTVESTLTVPRKPRSGQELEEARTDWSGLLLRSSGDRI
jgi:hypothetical protein